MPGAALRDWSVKQDQGSARAQATDGGGLELVELDLVSTGQPFDLVIANAGIMACLEGRMSDGFETRFGTNHLGHFVLVNRIASLLEPGSRLVNLSSAVIGSPT